MTLKISLKKYPTVEFKVEGGSKGEKCEKRVRRAYLAFFSIEIKKMENAFNQERNRLLDNDGSELKSLIQKCPTVTTFEKAKSEIEPKFNLTEPNRIKICIYDEKYPDGTGVASETRTSDYKNYNLCIYLKEFDDELVWTGHYICNIQMTIEDVTYHELVHTRGDILNPRTGIADSVVRHNYIGVIVTRALLRDQRVYSI